MFNPDSDDEVDEDVFVPPKKYEPAPAMWNIRKFADASLEEVLAKRVNCGNCPLYLPCEGGEGGTGWACPKCGTTAVRVHEPRPGHENEDPDDIIVVDCNKHKFERMDRSKNMLDCPLCSEGIAEIEVECVGAKNHVLFTEHSKVPIEQRHEQVKTAFVNWEIYYAEEQAKKAASGK